MGARRDCQLRTPPLFPTGWSRNDRGAHGQPPNIPWHFFWSVSQTMIERGEWARQSNVQVGYEIAHYAGSEPERAQDVFCRAFREFMTGFGPSKPRWGVKWLWLCATRGAPCQVESLWPETRWVVCLRDPFVTINSTKNTFVPHATERSLAEQWVRTCQFVESRDARRVVLFQMDKLNQSTEAERRAAVHRVLACVGEEPTPETDRFAGDWPLVHKAVADQDRAFRLSMEDRCRLLEQVPGLGFYLKRMGYDLPEVGSDVSDRPERTRE